MPTFKCYFPDCEYTTQSRSKIDMHHIIPREIDPRTKLTVPLCKTHHAMIYIEKATAGQHSIKCPDSLIIKGKFKSTDGDSILYENMEGKSFYWFPNSRDKWDE